MTCVIVSCVLSHVGDTEGPDGRTATHVPSQKEFRKLWQGQTTYPRHSMYGIYDYMPTLTPGQPPNVCKYASPKKVCLGTAVTLKGRQTPTPSVLRRIAHSGTLGTFPQSPLHGATWIAERFGDPVSVAERRPKQSHWRSHSSKAEAHIKPPGYGSKKPRSLVRPG